MHTMVFNPLQDYENNLKAAHEASTGQRFEALTQSSGINVEENRASVKEYDAQKAKSDQLQGKVSGLKGLRVALIVGIVLAAVAAVVGFLLEMPLLGIGAIVVAIGLLLVILLLLNPKIKNEAKLLEEELAKTLQLLQICREQMAALNALVSMEDGLDLVEKTLPSLKFQPNYALLQEKDMLQNYDFPEYDDQERSILDTLCGTYNGNPFLFETHLQHTMGTETYHGSLTIRWTERYTDSKGHRRTRTRSQTLHASVTKPKPFYSTETKLYYGAQASPDLSFSRLNLHHEDKTERQLKATIRKGEKKLQDMEEDALEKNKSFTGMANTQFEVLFGALNRNHETQFRLLFTPLAQTNMVDLILSETGYGDDFDFYKRSRMNTIVSEHIQGRSLRLDARKLCSHSYDICKENFLRENAEYFRSLYFDLAPLLAIPAYQDPPVHSLDPLPPYEPQYSVREYEVLANAMDASLVCHPKTKTQSILKTVHTAVEDDCSTVSVTAYSYDMLPRTDFVPKLGGDGRIHSVPVHWQEYVPLQDVHHMTVSSNPQTDANAHMHQLYARLLPNE